MTGERVFLFTFQPQVPTNSTRLPTVVNVTASELGTEHPTRGSLLKTALLTIDSDMKKTVFPRF